MSWRPHSSNSTSFSSKICSMFWGISSLKPSMNDIICCLTRPINRHLMINLKSKVSMKDGLPLWNYFSNIWEFARTNFDWLWWDLTCPHFQRVVFIEVSQSKHGSTWWTYKCRHHGKRRAFRKLVNHLLNVFFFVVFCNFYISTMWNQFSLFHLKLTSKTLRRHHET